MPEYNAPVPEYNPPMPAYGTPSAPAASNAAPPSALATLAPAEARGVSVKNVSLPDGAPTPEDTASEREHNLPNRRLLLTSSVLFGATYLPTFLTAMANSKGTSGALYVPVVGPFVEISKDTSAGNRALLVFSGVLQSAGVAGMISSLFIPEKRTADWPLLGKKRWGMTPVASRNTYHLMLNGSF
jgi:hypothetical protein